MGMKIALSLFDLTGTMLKPWLEAGYECHIVDIQHQEGTREDGMHLHNWDLREFPHAELLKLCERGDVEFLSSFTPCNSMSVSGARWMAGKGLRALAESISMVATSSEVADFLGCPSMIENPKSTLSTYWREPDHKWNPCDYSGYILGAENYTKETWLWCGNGFKMPPRKHHDLFEQPDKTYIHHQAPGPDRANIRSATPEGFARATFEANQ
jgi:hypothetical protein